MLEQEMASVIKFILDKAGNPYPYYWNVPEHFAVPAIYFPPPEITTGGETFLTYNADYVWYVIFFDRSSQAAYTLAYPVLLALRARRNLIPLIDEKGEETAYNVRTKDPELRVLDDGAAQLTIEWRNRRPYNADETEKMQTYTVENWKKPELYAERRINDAYAAVLEKYAETIRGGS